MIASDCEFYNPAYCDGHPCTTNDPNRCSYADQMLQDEEMQVETAIFDEEEIHPNCTVQILRNSVTGEVSIGWWDNDCNYDGYTGRCIE